VAIDKEWSSEIVKFLNLESDRKS